MLTVFDLVQRYLRSRGYKVTYVRNITDIDDKIIQRAADNGEDWAELARRFTVAMHEDCATLGLQPPDVEPRATEYIGPIIAMTQTLIDKGYAYVAADGDVMYSVRKFPQYGALSGKKIDDLRAGSRVQIDESKLDPLDFVLWKHAKPGEPSWPSPWGAGRPGWHIECSAMSTSVLGSHFDLHGGGLDLKFPHHENEIAQSCAACGTPFVNVWMHNGFVRIDDEKMSKSLGNFFTVRDVLKTLRDPEVLRFFLLSSHYRGPINYSAAQLAQADETLLGLYRALKGSETPQSSGGTARFRRSARPLSRGDGGRLQHAGGPGGDAGGGAGPEQREGRGGFRGSPRRCRGAARAWAKRSASCSSTPICTSSAPPELPARPPRAVRPTSRSRSCWRRAAPRAPRRTSPSRTAFAIAAQRGRHHARGQAGRDHRVAPSLARPAGTPRALTAASVGAPGHQHSEHDAHGGRDSNHLPRVVAHVVVGDSSDLFCVVPYLTGAVAQRALGGRQCDLDFGANSGDLRSLHVLDGPSQFFDVVEQVVEVAVAHMRAFARLRCVH